MLGMADTVRRNSFGFTCRMVVDCSNGVTCAPPPPHPLTQILPGPKLIRSVHALYPRPRACLARGSENCIIEVTSH